MFDADIMYILSLGTLLLTLLYLSYIVYFKRTGRTLLDDDPGTPNYRRIQRLSSHAGITGVTALLLIAAAATIFSVKVILRNDSTDDALSVFFFGVFVVIVPLILTVYFSYKILKNMK
jgi:hypothetical protein